MTPNAAAALFPQARHIYEAFEDWKGPKQGPPTGVTMPDDAGEKRSSCRPYDCLDVDPPDFEDAAMKDDEDTENTPSTPRLGPQTPPPDLRLVESDTLDLAAPSTAAQQPGPSSSTEFSSAPLPGASPSSSAPPRSTPRSIRDALDPSGGDLAFDGHALPPYSPPSDPVARLDYVWPPTSTDSWRAYLAWDWWELHFRYELFCLDGLQRRLYPNIIELCSESQMERQQSVCKVWGSDSFISRDPNPLTSADWHLREPAVRAFHRLVRPWPHVTLSDAPLVFADEAAFLDFEKSVWCAYCQTYYDFWARDAPLPALRPPEPWV